MFLGTVTNSDYRVDGSMLEYLVCSSEDPPFLSCSYWDLLIWSITVEAANILYQIWNSQLNVLHRIKCLLHFQTMKFDLLALFFSCKRMALEKMVFWKMASSVTSNSVPGKTALSNQQLRMKTQRRAAATHQMTMMCEDCLRVWGAVLCLVWFESELCKGEENYNFM